jgi:hypothetical protein
MSDLSVDLRGLLVLPVLKVYQDLGAPLVPQVLPGQPVRLAQRVLRALLAIQAQWVPQVLLGLRVLQVHRVFRDLKETPETLALLEPPARLALKDHRVFKVQLVPQVRKDW